MVGLRHQASLLAVLSLLFTAGASVSLACCAGLAVGAHVPVASASHCGGDAGYGQSCCDRAAEDAAARHCCEGGDAFERPTVSQQPALAASAALPLPTPMDLAGGEAAGSDRDPVPRTEPLYTLHSSLLI
ncbi:MAG TPA: hypothetical protein VMS86_05565 [Thermoanaerobaculia bacterium]|nr:hypothetical protein [Thermoanaerobaculia bacterium]